MVKRLIGSDTTGTDGSVSIPYAGTGAGVVNLSVETEIDGSIVSGTFNVFDCYRHDDGTISSHNDIWTLQNGSLNRDTEYSILKESTVGTNVVCGISNIPFKNYRIECDVYQVDGTQDEWCLNVLNTDYSTITSANMKLGEWKHISLDLNNIAPNSRVRLNTGGSCTELRFKNFMLYPYGDNDVISINASNPVIQSTETTNITGSLFIEGELQKNTNIDVYKNGTKVDTISTGSSGVASYTYTGTGAGATEFQFKYGSIVSEIFVVIDGTFFDKGLDGTGQHNDNWSNLNNRMILTRGTDGTELTSNADWAQLSAISSSTYFECDFCIEFDVLSLSDTPSIRFKNSSSTSGVFNIAATGYYKIEWKSDSITITLDGTPQTHYLSSLVGSDVSIYFEFSNTTDVLKYKNFVIYPI